MPDEKFEDVLEELRERGLEDDDIQRLSVFAGSPLRKERDAARQEAKRYRDAALKATFAEVGIRQKPEAVRIPDELDVADVDKVRQWAIDASFIDKPEPSPEELAAAAQLAADLAASARTADAASGGGHAQSGVISPNDVATWPADKLMRFHKQHPDEFEALKRGNEIVGLTFV